MDITRSGFRPAPWGARQPSPPPPQRSPSASPRVEADGLGGLSVEVQARTLLSAVAAPGVDIADGEAIVDYFKDLLVRTHVLDVFVLDLVQHGRLDHDICQLLGLLVGLHGAPRFGKTPALIEVEAAIAHPGAWHTKLCVTRPLCVAWDASAEARCPISLKDYDELVHPVVIGAVPGACVFEADDLLQWMLVSMQSPGRKDGAANPLDRTALHLRDVHAVLWAGRI